MVSSKPYTYGADRLFGVAYPELLRVAESLVPKNSASNIEPAELVNDFFLQFSQTPNLPKGIAGRAEFVGYARAFMKRILSRRSHSNDTKRTYTDVDTIPISFTPDSEALALHEALDRLAYFDPEKATLVDMYYRGYTTDEIGKSLGISSNSVRRHWRLTRSWLARELDYTEPVRAASAWFNDDSSPSDQARTPVLNSQLVTFNQQLYHWLLEDTTRLYSLSDEAFENLVADRLDAMGLGVQRVGSVHQKDGGVDLIAWPRAGCSFPFLVAAQVKHHRKNLKTGQPAIRDFHGVMTSQGSHFHLGMVVTNTSFSADAKWFAQNNSRLIRLRGLADLCRWMRNDFLNEFEWREIPDRIELAPGVSIQIPKKRMWLPD
jgi:RNA polymerase sigma factor (sigma-70 family)